MKALHALSSSEWSNILVLAELPFSLPVLNGKLQQVFSLLGIIKVDKRSQMSNETLADLLLLNYDKSLWTNPKIDLWWYAKAWRPLLKSRKRHNPCRSDEPSTLETVDPDKSEPGDALSDHDDLFLVLTSGTEGQLEHFNLVVIIGTSSFPVLLYMYVHVIVNSD